jgi:hypothetical protein
VCRLAPSTAAPFALGSQRLRDVLSLGSGCCCSQFEYLTELGHVYMRARKLCRELTHGVLFPMNQECSACTGLLVPSDELSLIGVCGEAVDRMDAGPYGNLRNGYRTGRLKTAEGAVSSQHRNCAIRPSLSYRRFGRISLAAGRRSRT